MEYHSKDISDVGKELSKLFNIAKDKTLNK